MLDVHTRQLVTCLLRKGSCAGREFSCAELWTGELRWWPGQNQSILHKPLRHGDILIWGQLPTTHCHPPGHGHIHRDPSEVMSWKQNAREQGFCRQSQVSSMPAAQGITRKLGLALTVKNMESSTVWQNWRLHKEVLSPGSITWLGRAWAFPPQNMSCLNTAQPNTLLSNIRTAPFGGWNDFLLNFCEFRHAELSQNLRLHYFNAAVVEIWADLYLFFFSLEFDKEWNFEEKSCARWGAPVNVWDGWISTNEPTDAGWFLEHSRIEILCPGTVKPLLQTSTTIYVWHHHCWCQYIIHELHHHCWCQITSVARACCHNTTVRMVHIRYTKGKCKN